MRLDALPAECSRIGAKEERSSIQKQNPVYGVVWMNVARVVIDRRQLNGLEAATVARDIGHGLEPLVDEVTRKDHQGGLHRDPSLRAPSGSCSTRRIQGSAGGRGHGSSWRPAMNVRIERSARSPWRRLP